MKEGRPSITARSVALARLQLSRPQTPEGDADAETRLYAGLKFGFPWSLPIARGRWMAGRTRFFDDETLHAVMHGITQVVILGAGYDGRALRFRQASVRFFEVDHPATQADKRRRIERLGIPLDHVQFVPIDLMTERIELVLPAAGHHRDQASLFLCEGLLLYLSMAAVEALLAGLRMLAAPGSRLLLTGREGAPTAKARLLAGMRRPLLAVIGEPRLSAFEPGETASLLDTAGWTIVREERRSTKSGNARLLIAAGLAQMVVMPEPVR
jgi:methyltransferase (TIGR00027 family)